MLDAIKSFFKQNIEPARVDSPTVDESDRQRSDQALQVAACALLLELAHADDEFSDEERTHIEEALQRHFDLSRETVEELVRLADEERRRAVDLYQFTKLIADQYDLGQKTVLAEIMWRVVYADGELAKHESYLMRKISNLLGLKPGYLADAQKKAAEGLE